MLEQLNKKREEYLARLEEIQAMDLDVVIEDEVNKVREMIKEEVLEKHNAALKAAELKVVVIDEMIADEAAKAEEVETVEEAVEEAQEESTETPIEE